MAFGVNPVSQTAAVQPRVEIRPLMRQVYMWMALGLLLTTAVSVVTISVPALLQLALNPVILIGAIIAELGLVIALSWGIKRMSTEMAIGGFFLYAGLNGFTLSLIFLAYNLGSIALAFGTTVILFFVMTMIAMTTSVDLSKYGSYLMMGVIGLVIAMVVNMFAQSGPLDYIISCAGVLIFTALTAYDTQKLHRMAADPEIQAEGAALLTKISVLGALTLYLDFINLFLFILRLVGGRD